MALPQVGCDVFVENEFNEGQCKEHLKTDILKRPIFE